MTKQSFLSLAWVLISCLMIALLCFRLFNQQVVIQTNMLELLPEARRDAHTLEAIKHHGGTFTNNVAFLIGANNKKYSHEAAKAVAEKLKSTELYKTVFDQIDDATAINLYKFYQPYASVLLAPQDYKILQQQDFETLKNRILASIMTPGFASILLERDPLLMFTQYLSSSRPYSGAFEIKNGMLTIEHQGRSYTLVNAVFEGNPFAFDTQAQFKSSYDDVQNLLATQFDGATILSTGMIHNAAAGVKQAQSEISTIGLGSLIGILLLFFIAFASLRPMLLALIPILIGVTSAVLICSLVFQSIHIMTLVFGASLIGVSIDYSLHFFAEQSFAGDKLNSKQCLSKIMPGITLGLITSLIGYCAFFIAPFPGLRQMALFSSVGLMAAYACVVFWFPYLPQATRSNDGGLARNAARALIRFWEKQRQGRIYIIPIGFVLFAMIGMLLIRADDDIRLLDNTPTALHQDRAQFESIANIKPTSQFILVSGAVPEDVLQAEEVLLTKLQMLIARDELAGYRAITSSLPSMRQQKENYKIVQNTLVNNAAANKLFLDIGYAPALVESFLQLYQAEEPRYLDFKTWQSSPYFNNAQWLQSEDGRYASIVQLYGLNNIDLLQQQINQLDNVQLVDQVGDITSVFGEYRLLANYLVLLAYVIIFMLLMNRYGFKFASLVLIPPVLAGAFAIAMSGYLGLTLTLFNSLALLLVLGIGIDYTLFFAENKGERSATMLGVLLSAITTILSFGLLALSSTPALQSIGITVLCGIAAAFILAPMVKAKVAHE